jgi:predicted alpha/beta hydrolase
MNLERVTNLKAPDGHSIPALSVSADLPRSGAVLLHPYGCSKEHMLGLALALAEKGVASLAIDLCGHGENMSAIGPGMLGEVDQNHGDVALSVQQQSGAVAARNHAQIL